MGVLSGFLTAVGIQLIINSDQTNSDGDLSCERVVLICEMVAKWLGVLVWFGGLLLSSCSLCHLGPHSRVLVA